MIVTKKQNQWRTYKPKNDQKGAASKLEVKIVKESEDSPRKDVQVFWVGSPQTGLDANKNAKFSWSEEKDTQSVTLKLGETDIGEILAVINGRKNRAGGEKGIYHQNPKGSTSFTFDYLADKGYYSIRIARKPNEGQLQAVTHTISIGEAQILKILLEDIVRLTYEW